MTEAAIPAATDDDFDRAFDEEGSPAPAGAPATPTPPDVTPPAQPAAAPPAEPNPPTQTPEPAPGGEPEPKAAEIVDWQQRYKELEHSTKSWDGRLKASARREQELLAQVETLKAEGAHPATPAPADADWQNDPELKKAAEEYPDVVAPLLKALKATRANAPAIPDVKPLSDRVEQLAREQHFARIAEKHPDFRELAQSDALPEWVQSKPAYLRPGLQTILQNGTSEEVVELLTDFKAERDAKAQSQTAEAARAAEAEKRQKQMQAAGAVKGRSGGVPQAEPAPDDFDTAWRMAPD